MMKLIQLAALSVAMAALGAGQTPPLFEANGDVGITPAKGKVDVDPIKAEYRVTGGGANIWGAVDAFQFAYKKMSGDIVMTADIHFVGTGAVAHRKAALMIRQSLDAGSAYADVAIHGDGLTSLQFRPTADAPTAEIRSELKGPVRIRIERRGNTFTMAAGNPGEELKPAGPATVVLQDPVYVGLAVSSHDANILETAIFTNVQVEPIAPRPRFSSKVTIFDLKTKAMKTVYQLNEIVEAPNWSRDGKFLLVNSRGRILRIPVDGPAGEPEPLKVDAALRCNNDHDLSKDGRLLAISCSTATSRGSQVYVAMADGSGARLIAPTVPSYFHGWSPDGKYLAFVGQRNGVYNLFRVPVNGGEEERLTSKPPYDDGPDYSPDGKWIYFNSNRSGNWDVWRVPATGGGPDDAKAEQVTKDDLEDWFPHPSPNGKHILVFSFPKGTKGHNDRMEGVQLRLMAMSGDKVKSVKPQTLATFFGGQGTINVNSWSPDSKRFAFVIFAPLSEDGTK